MRHVNVCRSNNLQETSTFEEYTCSIDSQTELLENDFENHEATEPNVSSENLVFQSIEEVATEEELSELANIFIESEDIDITDPPGTMIFLVYFLAFWQYAFSITDTALKSLITFIHVFIESVVCILPNGFNLGKFPKSLYMFQKCLGFPKNCFEKFPVCIKCYKLYKLENCSYKIQGEVVSKKCDNVLYPNHTQRGRRKQCGQNLMKTITAPSGKTTLVPYKVYCYKSLKENLQNLLRNPDFEEMCEKWRELEHHEDTLSDVYDGRVWAQFNGSENGHRFFNTPRNYGLMLNCDWFQPFKHVSSFSVGAIYLVVLNLPRVERLKRKNVILVGLIPSMEKEPPTNTFLEPMVEELKEAWVGYHLYSNDVVKEFRLALLIIGCDIPAARKLCGFLGNYTFIPATLTLTFSMFT